LPELTDSFFELRLSWLYDLKAAARWTIPLATFMHRSVDNLSHKRFGELADLRVLGDS